MCAMSLLVTVCVKPDGQPGATDMSAAAQSPGARPGRLTMEFQTGPSVGSPNRGSIGTVKPTNADKPTVDTAMGFEAP